MIARLFTLFEISLNHQIKTERNELKRTKTNKL